MGKDMKRFVWRDWEMKGICRGAGVIVDTQTVSTPWPWLVPMWRSVKLLVRHSHIIDKIVGIASVVKDVFPAPHLVIYEFNSPSLNLSLIEQLHERILVVAVIVEWGLERGAAGVLAIWVRFRPSTWESQITPFLVNLIKLPASSPTE